MRTRRIVAAAVVAVLAAMGGCSGKGLDGSGRTIVDVDQSSPRLLAMTLHEAWLKNDYEAYVQCMEGDYRRPFRTRLMAVRDYANAMGSLADLAEKKLGDEPAGRFRARVTEIVAARLPSPLAGAVENGKVAWDKVKILDEGDHTSIMLTGSKSVFDDEYTMKESGGKWYISPRMEDVAPGKRKDFYSRATKDDQKESADLVKSVNNIKKDITAGKINRDNWREKLAPPTEK